MKIKFLGLFWVPHNRFTKLFWLRDRKTGSYIAKVPFENRSIMILDNCEIEEQKDGNQ